MTFIQARNYTRGRAGASISMIVIHDMEAPQGTKTAEDVAEYFHNQTPGNNGSSAHCCVDENSIVDCVRESDTAWAAPNANRDGLHIEHAGYAKNNRQNWLDANNTAMLEISAARAAHWSIKYGIPVRRLTLAEIRDGHKGFAGHVDITNALCGGSGHTDPGPNFPWDYYLKRVEAHVHAQAPAKPEKPAKRRCVRRKPSTPSWYKRPLREGDKGADVCRMQQRLVAHGHKRVTCDGVFGPFTKAALEDFQRKARGHLTVDGICGPATARKLG